MVMALYTRDRNRHCPDCGERDLDFLDVPESRRTHTNEEGEEHTHHFGPARDYKCRNCDCEFTLTRWED